MIILVFFTPFFIAIFWLYMIDLDNTKMINAYFLENKCKNIFYYKSKYKAFCKDSVLSINNQFNINFSSNEVIKFNAILNIQDNEKNIEIKSKNKKMLLEFKNEEDKKTFLKSLKGIKNK